MSKVFVIPDVHLKPWMFDKAEELLSRSEYDKIVCLGDHYYWYMLDCYPENLAVDLINRTTTDYLEYRDGAYYYKERHK